MFATVTVDAKPPFTHLDRDLPSRVKGLGPSQSGFTNIEHQSRVQM